MALHITPMRAHAIPLRTAIAPPVRRTSTAATGTNGASNTTPGTTATTAAGVQQNSSSSAAASGAASGFQAVLNDSSSSAGSTAVPPSTSPATPAQTDSVPTPESAFGGNPWLNTPVGNGPNGIFYYNNIYFATPAAAAQVAQMVGGKVVDKNMFSGDNSGNPYQQQQPNEMVLMPNGALINPGLVASFYTHGYSQSTINTMIAQEVANTPGTKVG